MRRLCARRRAENSLHSRLRSQTNNNFNFLRFYECIKLVFLFLRVYGVIIKLLILSFVHMYNFRWGYPYGL
jgi:hypothetical protein